jgi:hypothetical protein
LERLRLKEKKVNRFHSPIAPTFCNRCRDFVDQGCDPWDELAELNALSERLKLKHYDLKRKVNQLHSPIIHQLPPDVTSTIFEFCLPDFTDHQLSPYRDTKKEDSDLSIPLSLGAICSYWRDIAWSTPSLWSSLVVRVTRKHDSHIVIGIAQEWLARSGQLPLSIRISSAVYKKAIPALADIINQYSTRWSDLDLYIPDCYYKCFHATDNHAPILKSIRFKCSMSSLYSMIVNFQLTCPRLERASLSYLPMDENHVTNIQWDNLTHLTLRSIPIFNSFLILCKTPRLVFCEVSGYIGNSSRNGERGIRTPVLTSLRSLQLLVRSFAEDFLNNLIVPHLEEFSLPKYYNPSMEVITSFLRRSACSLRSFSMVLSNFPPYFEGFMNILQSLPSLNTLSIISITTLAADTTPEDCDPWNILQLVANVLSSQSTSLQQGFLPNLKILEYTGKLYLSPGNYEDLYSLPPADNAVHGPLHLLKLDLYPATRIPKNMISYLSSLVERGVTVNVLSNSEDILQSSIDYYRRREDFLRRDWIDNWDSSLFS